jgi:hypothetical protein
MPRIGVSITKQIAFRNSLQEFSNVYYYEVLTLPDSSQANTFITNLTNYEKNFHSSLVTFVRGRCWSQIGTKEQNEMIAQANLSGTGARVSVNSFDSERAFLFRLRAGVDSRGNPVYLRKYYHSCGLFVTGTSIGSGVLQNTSGFTQGERDAQVAAMNQIGDANGSPLTPKICSKNGRLPGAGNVWSAHQFLEHHQLGDMWRAA